jgi:hypothetical protein
MQFAAALGRVILMGGFLSGLWVAAAEAQPWSTLVAAPATEAERLALVDLQRYLTQAGGNVPKVISPRQWSAKPSTAVLWGTPAENPLLRAFDVEQHALGEQGYFLANQTLRSQRVVVAAGGAPPGAVNAAYGLLRELGFGFFLGSESVPDALPAELPQSPVARQPCFGIRGVLPWYNFFNSPTVWDPVDHRAFVDQLIRSGANFVGFHTYDDEPFAAYPEKGAMRWGARLRNTESPNWGTHPTPAAKFAFGTDKLFDADFFGAATTRLTGSSNEIIQLEQDILRDALDYAKRRGVRTCLGFEINGDPTRAGDRDIFLKRLNRVLEQYPSLDFLWLWQPETGGAQGYTKQCHGHPLRDLFQPGSAMENYGLARREVFHRAVEQARGEKPYWQDTETGRAARAREGARLEQFAQLALRAFARRANPPRLVLSGWGGDDRLLSAEYYDGLDKLLPASVVFASLDFIWPRPRVDRVYGELPPSRERWPIPWLELDGDQWQPQPWVHTYEAMARDIQRGGSQGALGIHWRTRDLEENFAFLVDYAWQPGLTAEEFFRQFAQRCYPAVIVSEMAAIHRELDRLGYRWVNGGGQAECAPFHWGPGTDEQVRKLEQLQARVRALLPQAGRGRERAQWLVDTMEWCIRFQQAEKIAVQAQTLLAERQPQAALDLLNGDALALALQAFAHRVTTRGEHGVLATINTKAVHAWRDLQARALAALNQSKTPSPERQWKPAPRILLPRFVGSVAAGEAVELTLVVLGGSPAWLHYRRLGEPRWRSLALAPVQGWVFRAEIPARDVHGPGLEIGFSFNADPQARMSLGPQAFTVMPKVRSSVIARSEPAEARTTNQGHATSQLQLAAKTDGKFPIELSWDELLAADYFRVFRNGKLLAETAVAFFPDAPTEPAAAHSYRVEALREGKVLAEATTNCTLAGVELTEAPQPRLVIQTGGVEVRWPAFKSPHVAVFKLRWRSDGQDRTVWIPAKRSGEQVHELPLTPGRSEIQITPASASGREGAPWTKTIQWPPVERVDRLEWSLDQPPKGARVHGDVTFTLDGAVLNGGHITFDHAEQFNATAHFRLAFEFKADRVDGMPVLLSHGLWQVDGWFAQILGGRLVIRTAASDAQGPAIEPGRWYAVAWEVNDGQHRLLVDGQLVSPSAELKPAVAQRPLRLGQYELIQPEFAFRGTLRRVKIESGVRTLEATESVR